MRGSQRAVIEIRCMLYHGPPIHLTSAGCAIAGMHRHEKRAKILSARGRGILRGADDVKSRTGLGSLVSRHVLIDRNRTDTTEICSSTYCVKYPPRQLSWNKDIFPQVRESRVIAFEGTPEMILQSGFINMIEIIHNNPAIWWVYFWYLISWSYPTRIQHKSNQNQCPTPCCASKSKILNLHFLTSYISPSPTLNPSHLSNAYHPQTSSLYPQYAIHHQGEISHSPHSSCHSFADSLIARWVRYLTKESYVPLPRTLGPRLVQRQGMLARMGASFCLYAWWNVLLVMAAILRSFISFRYIKKCKYYYLRLIKFLISLFFCEYSNNTFNSIKSQVKLLY